MYGRREVLASLAPYKLAACTDLLPGPASAQSSRWETGRYRYLYCIYNVSIMYL